ncbi:MAG TPA: hypothetical protein VE998_05460 [Terriglobales bacterium]|nr:hypothetical protein [Terriglobales bacterium]
MSTTLFEAPQYDPEKARKRKIVLVTIASVVVLAAVVLYVLRNWPEERVVEHFFTALQNKNFEQAYGIWIADPQWKQHPQQHPQYSFDDFYKDWGPSGEWGVIRNFHVDGTAVPKGGGSGVVVVVTVNDIVGRKANIWVERKDKSLTFSPFETCEGGQPCT